MFPGVEYLAGSHTVVTNWTLGTFHRILRNIVAYFTELRIQEPTRDSFRRWKSFATMAPLRSR